VKGEFGLLGNSRAEASLRGEGKISEGTRKIEGPREVIRRKKRCER